jgi:hypothetical protein
VEAIGGYDAMVVAIDRAMRWTAGFLMEAI